jgi:hypothetical protein
MPGKSMLAHTEQSVPGASPAGNIFILCPLFVFCMTAGVTLVLSWSGTYGLKRRTDLAGKF